MKKFFGEFKEFISKGNVLDMAVGVIIGGAFNAIVTSLVGDIITPVIKLISGGSEEAFASLHWKSINYGNFINTVLSFLITAFAVFLIVKAANKMKKEEVVEPTEKECPYCISKINIKATKCPHCASDVSDVK
ncbi:MAG: large conductance mechanosensitive channel protein MscL [Lachnospiraceae bacterium]|nr:large conductance mechanosensitive channel protein MscL [Lachnospiraceae bacterium]